MSDLIERGRDWVDCLDCADVPLVTALCDEIERLQARVEALEYTIKTLIWLDDCKESPTGKHTWLTGDDFNYCAFCNASSQATEQEGE